MQIKHINALIIATLLLAMSLFYVAFAPAQHVIDGTETLYTQQANNN
jgi:hypothetical protein